MGTYTFRSLKTMKLIQPINYLDSPIGFTFASCTDNLPSEITIFIKTTFESTALKIKI